MSWRQVSQSWLCNTLSLHCQASQQSATYGVGRVKRKLEWDADQLVAQKLVALQCALQERSAEVAELQAQLASLKRAKTLTGCPRQQRWSQ